MPAVLLSGFPWTLSACALSWTPRQLAVLHSLGAELQRLQFGWWCRCADIISPDELSRTVRAVILAGGETQNPLSRYRAMPAVPLGKWAGLERACVPAVIRRNEAGSGQSSRDCWPSHAALCCWVCCVVLLIAAATCLAERKSPLCWVGSPVTHTGLHSVASPRLLHCVAWPRLLASPCIYMTFCLPKEACSEGLALSCQHSGCCRPDTCSAACAAPARLQPLAC